MTIAILFVIPNCQHHHEYQTGPQDAPWQVTWDGAAAAARPVHPSSPRKETDKGGNGGNWT